MINRKTSAADLLRRRIEATSKSGKKPEAIRDGFAQALGQRLEERGITRVPGLPEEPEPAWYDLAIGFHHRQQALAREHEARKKAEEQAHNAPQTAAGVVRAAIKPRDRGAPIPLNGAAVLRAALGGVGNAGTINGQ